MARCEAKGFNIKADQVGKLKNEDIIAISVIDDLVSCAKIDTRNIDNKNNVVNLANVYYNAANVPEDNYGCSKNKCYNTGTLQGDVTTAATDVVIGNFYKNMDATLYATGIMTAFIYLPEGEHEVSLDIANYTQQDWMNYATIKTTVHATQGEGFYAVKFDFASADQTENGTGWLIDQIGVKLRFKIGGANLKADDIVGVSSLAFYESLEDFQISNTILVTCMDNWGDSQSFDVIEGACSTSEYDPNSGTMTATITTNKYTENLRLLNPTLRKSDEQNFGTMKIVTRKVLDAKEYFTGKDDTLAAELEGYGIVQLSDTIEGDCGFLYVQTPGCANNSHALTRVNAPIPVIAPTDGDLFQMLSSNYKGDYTKGLVLVGHDWVGQELNFVYRKQVTAEIYEVTNEFRDTRVNILAPLRKKDGTEEYHLYENAFITAVNNNISRSDETTVELNFTIAADENGVRKKVAKILDK